MLKKNKVWVRPENGVYIILYIYICYIDYIISEIYVPECCTLGRYH